jgi:PAS domain S-box-containing protein
MEQTLRILHLEDNPMDASLVSATLAAEAIRCEIVHASTRPGFLAALEDGPYDLILSDFALPGFDGVSAQTIARARHPEVPFLFVSGTMGEEVAIERLKDGATDYVLKHRLTRLAPAVRRALDEAGNRRQRAAAEAEVRRLNVELQIALGQANSFLDSVVENLPDVVVVKDARKLQYLRVNRAFEQLLGHGRHALIGKRAEDVFPQPVADRFETSDREALAGPGIIDEREEIVVTRELGPRVFQTKRIPIAGDTGEPRYLLEISHDVTERRTAEENARLSKLEAERANRAKSEFLSRMSHDLRTPLNAMLGFAQLLELDRLSPEQADSVQQILIGGRHLLELINEVLDISRIEAGRMSLSPEPVSVSGVVQQVADMIRPLAAARGITLTVDVVPVARSCVRADRQRLKQVLLNFLGNAVKYNRERGHISIAARIVEDGRIRTSVTDTGAGIPPERLALLFRAFERLGADASAVEGAGLGLAVAKGLTEAMGGSVGVTSEVNQGTTFWVDLPEAAPAADVAHPAAEAPGAPSAAPGGTILYIEDNHANVRLLQRLLGRRGTIRLETESHGDEGIARARRDRPDLILLDLHLPDLSGEEVLRRLREDPLTRSLPVAVLSADATPAQRQRVLASGAVAYLTKPLDIAALLRLIDERLGSRAVREDA